MSTVSDRENCKVRAGPQDGPRELVGVQHGLAQGTRALGASRNSLQGAKTAKSHLPLLDSPSKSGKSEHPTRVLGPCCNRFECGVHTLVAFKRRATRRANEISQRFAQLCFKTSFRAITEGHKNKTQPEPGLDSGFLLKTAARSRAGRVGFLPVQGRRPAWLPLSLPGCGWT